MQRISIIAALDEKGGLGKNNQLLCHLPADLKHFKTLTLGKPIIMGRKTFQSIGKALPGRKNIVLSKQQLVLDQAHVVQSMQEALAMTQSFDEVMIIGGAQLFYEALPLTDRLYLTIVHAALDADTFFPPWDPAHWKCANRSFYEKDERNMYDMTFVCYDRQWPDETQRPGQ